MRAYSHQGHGPRADQTGRIHISDFRKPRTISIAKRSRSIHPGQTRLWVWAYPLVRATPKSRSNGDQIAALVVCYGIERYAVERLG
jgi:hypothetical protein